MIGLFKHLKPYTKSISLVLILMLVAILLELLVPTLMANIVDIGIVNKDIPYILRTGSVMIVCSILAMILTITVMYFSAKIALGFGRDIRRRLFIHVENFSLHEFEQVGPASLITRTTNDIRQVQDVINMMLRMMVRAPIMLVGGIFMAVSRDAKLSLVFLAALPVLFLLIFLISRRVVPLFGALQKKTDRLNLLIRENLIGIRVIRAFNRVKYEKERFNIANEDYRDTGTSVNQIIAFMFPVMMVVMNLTSISIIWFGAIRIDNGAMQVGNLLAFLQYAMLILFALNMLSMAFVMIPRAQASAKRVNEVLMMQSDMKDPVNPTQITGQHGHLEFKNVTFRYHGAEKPAVENISFQAKPGQTTAIIGSTGAGKTTLVQMITRFYEVERGAILVDGVDIREMKVQDLRSKIGYVPQRTTLFTGTIADNVRYGKRDATEEEITVALQTAQAMDFVGGKEDGIHAVIEQAGANLSGGQKQRLSIARAVVRKPEIYIFDDSFSALDYKTDAKLKRALNQVKEQATVVLVAQRISTVIDADQIIVLNEGKVAGIGNHRELLKDNKIYQEIVSSQQTEEESA